VGVMLEMGAETGAGSHFAQFWTNFFSMSAWLGLEVLVLKYQQSNIEQEKRGHAVVEVVFGPLARTTGLEQRASSRHTTSQTLRFGRTLKDCICIGKYKLSTQSTRQE
jgi:hypothetical protein